MGALCNATSSYCNEVCNVWPAQLMRRTLLSVGARVDVWHVRLTLICFHVAPSVSNVPPRTNISRTHSEAEGEREREKEEEEREKRTSL